MTAATNANTNANGRVPSGRKVNGKALTDDIVLGAGDVGAYTKAETDTRVAAVATTANSAMTTANTATTAATNANTNANGRVPSARKVNGKALTADITLAAADVGALPAAGTAAAATKLATPRKINGVTFDGSADITLTPANLGFGEVADGYYRLPGGLIIQWGYISQSSAGVVDITFPIPFPNRIFSITATPTIPNPTGNDTVSIRSISNTAFAINRMAQGAASWSAYYIAIGN